MIGSLYSGISGLNANSKAMSVIGDNIANVNTTGFKSSSVSFANVLSRSIGGASSSQVGRGVAVSKISPLWSSGTLETTGNATDLAINGKGLFVVNDGSGQLFFTRDGQFQFDKDANLVNPEGMVVQGYAVEDGVRSETLSGITIPSGSSNPIATTQMMFTINLDAGAVPRSAAQGTLDGAFDITAVDGDAGNLQVVLTGGGTAGAETADLTGSTLTVQIENGVSTRADIAAAIAAHERIATAALIDGGTAGDAWTLGVGNDMAALEGGFDGDSYSNTLTVYDSLGSPVEITVDFTSLGDRRWEWRAAASDGTCTATGTLTFDEDGSLSLPLADPVIPISDLSSGAEDLSIVWALTGNGSFTGYASPSTTTSVNQNGYSAGTLQSVSVDEAGVITGVYSNGQMTPLYQIALGDFPNYDGLSKIGGNLYMASLASGQASVGVSGTGSLGSISPSSLEMSNVDLAKEFVKMITTQRAFQANSRVITTSDEILTELINIKR